jgi:hypothetical protein
VADGQAPLEGVAEGLFPFEDLGQGNLLAGHHREAPLGRVGGRRERVDGRHLERKLRPSDPGQFGGQDEEIGAVGQRRQHPCEGEGELVPLRGRGVLAEAVDGILEGQQGAGIDLHGQVQVDRPAAPLLGVEVDLPVLAQRVRLEEVALVVDVEAMPDGMVLQIGHVPRDVDNGQVNPFVRWCRPPSWQSRSSVTAWHSRGSRSRAAVA